MTQQIPAYTAKTMTKEQFFYCLSTTCTQDGAHVLLESGRGGNLSIAGINPLAKLQA